MPSGGSNEVDSLRPHAIINDLNEVYLIGIQLGIEQILMAELLLSFEHTMTLTCGCVEVIVNLLR